MTVKPSTTLALQSVYTQTLNLRTRITKFSDRSRYRLKQYQICKMTKVLQILYLYSPDFE